MADAYTRGRAAQNCAGALEMCTQLYIQPDEGRVGRVFQDRRFVRVVAETQPQRFARWDFVVGPSATKVVEHTPSFLHPADVVVKLNLAAMDYILVLQWRAGERMTLERLVCCENAIMALLENTAEVDGHDWSASEMNIFVLTENPTATFDQITQMLQETGVYDSMRAAFRHIDTEDYTILAPPGLTVFAVS